MAPVQRGRALRAVLVAGLLGLAPTVAIADDAVSEDALIAADRAQVLAVLADYDQLAAMNADVLDYRVEADAPCQRVYITTRGVMDPIHYILRRCPTASGWKETLVSGDASIEAIEVEWQLVPEGDQTRVKLSILARIAKVPQFLVDQHTRRNVARTLKNLASKLDPTRH